MPNKALYGHNIKAQQNYQWDMPFEKGIDKK